MYLAYLAVRLLPPQLRQHPSQKQLLFQTALSRIDLIRLLTIKMRPGSISSEPRQE
jgi:hypothetical protein